MNTQAIALLAGKAMLGATLVLGFATAPASAAAPNEDEPGVSTVISDDDSRWSCVDDGNRVCGPQNAEGKPAGCYDDGGVMLAPWPCEAWTPADGYRHGTSSTTDADGTVTR